jgi:hypothetical protein
MRANVFGGHGLETTAATISSEDVNASMASNSLMVHPWFFFAPLPLVAAWCLFVSI